MQTIIKHLELIKKYNSSSNENILEIHHVLKIIQGTNAWQSKNYYKGQEDFIFQICSQMDFRTFIKEIFGITGTKFQSIEDILSLDNGKELFLKYGRSNMSTYYNSTKKERKAILDMAEGNNGKRRLSPFQVLKRDAFPSIKQKKVSKINIESAKKMIKNIKNWKTKYEEEKKKRIKIEKEFTDYKKMINDTMGQLKKIA